MRSHPFAVLHHKQLSNPWIGHRMNRERIAADEWTACPPPIQNGDQFLENCAQWDNKLKVKNNLFLKNQQFICSDLKVTT